MTNQDLSQIQNLVNSAKNVLVLTHKNPSLDTMASALSLYLAAVQAGKTATIAMESAPLVEVANLIGINKVQTQLGGKNLVITFNTYQSGDVEKVSCAEDLDNSKFNLTLVPKDGIVLDTKNISYSAQGGGYDLIYTVGTVNPEGLGTLFDQGLFSSAQIINIDNHDENRDYGRFNLVEPDAASVAEIVTFYLRAMGLKLDEEIAGNLYQGLRAATNNFQSPKVSAATFEAAAICLRALAPKAKAPAAQTEAETQQPDSDNAPQQEIPVEVNPSAEAASTPPGVPQDWLGPKIYRGTSNV